jgi:hypothetical protein
VKALAKPSITVWAVNQLYWKHRDAFDQLIAVGERVRRAQASQLAGKTADMRGALAERRDALSGLSRLADGVLRDAGHNATPETMRRITTTLEALSIYPAPPDGVHPGRLSQDLDPPGFDSVAALIPGFKRAESPQQKPRQSATGARAKAVLQAAEQNLRQAQALAENAAMQLKKAKERLAKAIVAAEEARERVRSLTVEVENTDRMLRDAERAVEKARISSA